MTLTWDRKIESRYQQKIEVESRRAYRVATALACVLFPAGAVLDVFTQPAQWRPLLLIRLSATLLYILLYLGARRGRYPGRPFAAGVLILGLASAAISLMCLVLDGYRSPYYAGVNLVVLAAGILFPWNARKMTGAVLAILSIYVGCVLLQADLHGVFQIDRIDLFVNNFYFLFATGVITISGSALAERFRRESFKRLREIEDAQTKLMADLKQGAAPLIETTSDASLAALTQEVVARKEQLQRSVEFIRAARDDAQSALDLRDEFISMASHELKTPLTSMTLKVQLALRRADPSTAQNVLMDVSRQLGRLERLISDMLDISKINRGKLTLEPLPVDLGALTEEVVNRVREQHASQGVAISLKRVGYVHGEWDPIRIEQVVNNLLGNAVKYGAGKPVELSLWMEGQNAYLTVTDQGIGISKEDQSRIFQRFERVISSERIGGLGLGLYIAQQIIEAHGGTISVDSETNRGSTFTVTLPVRAANVSCGQ